jgi:hypothetical protein
MRVNTTCANCSCQTTAAHTHHIIGSMSTSWSIMRAPRWLLLLASFATTAAALSFRM